MYPVFGWTVRLQSDTCSLSPSPCQNMETSCVRKHTHTYTHAHALEQQSDVRRQIMTPIYNHITFEINIFAPATASRRTVEYGTNLIEKKEREREREIAGKEKELNVCDSVYGSDIDCIKIDIFVWIVFNRISRRLFVALRSLPINYRIYCVVTAAIDILMWTRPFRTSHKQMVAFLCICIRFVCTRACERLCDRMLCSDKPSRN